MNECLKCHATNLREAPYCEACGFNGFKPVEGTVNAFVIPANLRGDEDWDASLDGPVVRIDPNLEELKRLCTKVDQLIDMVANLKHNAHIATHD